MTPTPTRSEAADPRVGRLRRLLIVLAGLVTVLALIHHADHVIRGELVLSYGLDRNWNHSGWPFQSSLTPFTASLLAYLILVPGIVFTARGRLGAGYWLAASLASWRSSCSSTLPLVRRPRLRRSSSQVTARARGALSPACSLSSTCSPSLPAWSRCSWSRSEHAGFPDAGKRGRMRARERHGRLTRGRRRHEFERHHVSFV